MITKTKVQSCCGGKYAYVLALHKPVKKQHLALLDEAGYSSPKHYAKVGLFFITKNGMIASSSFGNTRLQVKCGDKNIGEVDSLIEILERIL